MLRSPVRIELVTRPSELRPDQVQGKVVVVIDAIRATTSMLCALDAGAREIRVFSEIDACRAAAQACSDPRILAGERQGAPIDGFDLGNAPAEYTRDVVGGKRLFMTTTNGTRAILAAEGAAEVLIGAFVNRMALADHLRKTALDVTLLCAGQDGQRASEDELAGHSFHPLLHDIVKGPWPPVPAEMEWVKEARFQDGALLEARLLEALPVTTGGRTLIRNGFGDGLAECARADALSIVGVARGGCVGRWGGGG